MGGQVNAVTPLKDVIECQVFNPLYKVLNMPLAKKGSQSFYKEKHNLNVGSFSCFASTMGAHFFLTKTQFCTFTGK